MHRLKIAVAIVWLTGSPAVEAKRPVDDQLALARICAKEEGWDASDGCVGIHHVLTQGSRYYGMTYAAYAREYSRSAFTGRFKSGRRSPRPYYADLWPEGRRPKGWPGKLSWPRHRGSWLRLYRFAGEIQAGAIEDPCEETPDHWGDHGGDKENAERWGWEPVECGRVANLFWAAPARWARNPGCIRGL